MVNSLTNYGQRIALYQDDRSAEGHAGSTTNTGGLLKLADRLHLYKTGTTLTKDRAGQTVVEASGATYAAKTGLAGLEGSGGAWTVQLTSGNLEIQLTDQTWTASGGDIAGILGAYLTDANDNIIAWWERASEVTLNDGDSITADDLIIRLT